MIRVDRGEGIVAGAKTERLADISCIILQMLEDDILDLAEILIAIEMAALVAKNKGDTSILDEVMKHVDEDWKKRGN